MAFVIEDDILAPREDIEIKYNGPNPFAIYEKIPKLLQTIFKARGVHYYEDEFRWDVTGDPRVFHIKMHLDKGIDRRTRGVVRIKLDGDQPVDPKKPGAIKIKIKGKIITSFPIETIFQRIFIKPFIWLYFHLIYINIRRKYIEIYKKGVEELESEIRATFGLMMRERLT